ncbi:MAG TPA: ABC transporter substrate-binding protein [Burkholderiales bacterium]|nr:ABC transporter substrate-binding protein [Burkholderiales bacterium]
MAWLSPRALRALVVVFFSAFAAAAWAQPKPLQTLNVIVFPGGFNLPIWAAERQGFFEQNGIRVVITPTPSSTFQMQGLAEGRFDIAMTAMDNVVAYQEGQGEAKIPDNPDMFAFMGADNGFLSLVGGKGVKSFADLKGQKLSVDALTTGYAFVLRELLARNGIAESEVTFERAGGVSGRFQALLKGAHAGTMLITPFDILAMNQGHPQLARAAEHLGAYQGVVAASRRSWAKDNEAALVGYIRAWQAGVAFLYDPRNRDVAEALLVANIRAMSPQLAKQSLQVLLDERTGFFKDPALDLKGVATVLALRSKFAEPRKSLTDPSKYVDSSYVEKARKP